MVSYLWNNPWWWSRGYIHKPLFHGNTPKEVLNLGWMIHKHSGRMRKFSLALHDRHNTTSCQYHFFTTFFCSWYRDFKSRWVKLVIRLNQTFSPFMPPFHMFATCLFTTSNVVSFKKKKVISPQVISLAARIFNNNKLKCTPVSA